MQNQSKPPPETSLEAVQLREWREWLAQPVTKLFFAQLREDEIMHLRTAAIAALQTGIGNAKEHNKLVMAAAIEQIINKYGNTTKYPITFTGSADPG